jgi:hypothetical protein
VSNPLSYIGLSDAQWQAAEAAYRNLGLATPSSPAPTAPTLNLRRLPSSSSAGPSTRSACEIYDAAKAAGQQAAILAALKPKCDAEKRLGTSYTPGGASRGGGATAALAIGSGGTLAPIDGKTAPTSDGPSPILLAAGALAVGVVGFVVVSRMRKKK